ncbi:hypothetical protein IWX90DRAFT_272423 [Phyllosticta citrichinensis]|uniref:Secreted protein n=1 Tax=Phyllosticta citrichinensis TaxID=1130410 RepID=A0ABR1XMV7_9PEZI
MFKGYLRRVGGRGLACLLAFSVCRGGYGWGRLGCVWSSVKSAHASLTDDLVPTASTPSTCASYKQRPSQRNSIATRDAECRYRPTKCLACTHRRRHQDHSHRARRTKSTRGSEAPPVLAPRVATCTDIPKGFICISVQTKDQYVRHTVVVPYSKSTTKEVSRPSIHPSPSRAMPHPNSNPSNPSVPYHTSRSSI